MHVQWCERGGSLLLGLPAGTGPSGFTGGAVGKHPRGLQHGLPAGRLLGHVVVEPPQAFLQAQHVGAALESVQLC